MLEYNSCDNTHTNKGTLRMHKDMTQKANLSNCYEYDYSCTKNEVPVMHKFRKQRWQEPPRKPCKLCDFTYLTTGGLRFLQNAKHSGLKGPQEFKCALCDYTASKNDTLSKHRIRAWFS